MLDTTSSLSAIRRVEWSALLANQDTDEDSDVPTLDRQWRGFIDRVYWKEPHALQHEAVRSLVQSFDGVENGTMIRSVAMQKAQERFPADPDNLLARLLYACIIDVQLEADKADAARRYESLDAVIRGRAPAARATLYNNELLQTWLAYVTPNIKRPDVAASTVASLPWGTIDEHIAVLPRVQRRLRGIADQLRAEGRDAEAKQCMDAFARCMVQLILSEPDVATRLLCADLLSSTFDADSEPAKKLQQLRSDFRAAAAAAPIDVFDQSGTARNALVPDVYRRALYSLVATIAGIVLAAGALLLLIICGATAPIAAMLVRGEATNAEPNPLPRWQRGVLLFAPTILAIAFVVPHFGRPRYFSDAWLYVAMLMLAAFGALAPIAVASVRRAVEPQIRRWRYVASIGPAIVAAMFFLVPDSTVAWTCRKIDLSIGTPVLLLIPCLAIAIAVGLYASPARLRDIAAAAARVVVVCAVLAICILWYHRSADREYQQAVVTWRFDEITARLGEGWQAKYLKPAFDACGVPLK